MDRVSVRTALVGARGPEQQEADQQQHRGPSPAQHPRVRLSWTQNRNRACPCSLHHAVTVGVRSISNINVDIRLELCSARLDRTRLPTAEPILPCLSSESRTGVPDRSEGARSFQRLRNFDPIRPGVLKVSGSRNLLLRKQNPTEPTGTAEEEEEEDTGPNADRDSRCSRSRAGGVTRGGRSLEPRMVTARSDVTGSETPTRELFFQHKL